MTLARHVARFIRPRRRVRDLEARVRVLESRDRVRETEFDALRQWALIVLPAAAAGPAAVMPRDDRRRRLAASGLRAVRNTS